ncbi:hypothetical protein RZS08_67735, partial [Arthrospira platensis SPKY1]|nr:hypothetical protein [Arthrospira platensis SPKY1]
LATSGQACGFRGGCGPPPRADPGQSSGTRTRTADAAPPTRQPTSPTGPTIAPVKTRHFVQLIGLSALWGASFMFLRIASPVLGPWVLAGGRVALAALTLALL